MTKKKAEQKPRKLKEYALYKNEELLITGTCREIADYLGYSIANTLILATPSYKKTHSETSLMLFKIH